MITKRTKIQILNVKTLQKKLNDLATGIQITTQGVNSGYPEGLALPVPPVVPSILLVN